MDEDGFVKTGPDLSPAERYVEAKRRAGERAGLGLTLAQVAPVGMTVAVAALARFGHDEDDSGEGHRAERRNSGWGGHRR